jgi:DNA mismatch endonuclease, patch repair protein
MKLADELRGPPPACHAPCAQQDVERRRTLRPGYGSVVGPCSPRGARVHLDPTAKEDSPPMRCVNSHRRPASSGLVFEQRVCDNAARNMPTGIAKTAPRTRLDPLSKHQRSQQMALVRSTDTKPERVVRKTLFGLGYRYRLHSKSILGRPDIVLRRYRTVIFVHGCFWHRHPGCPRTRTPRSRVIFWKAKFDQNVERDRRVRAMLRRDGWRVLVIWECTSENHPMLARRLRCFLEKSA